MGAAKGQALQEWRDRATHSLDAFDALTAREGRLHHVIRQRRRHAIPEEPPRLEMPPRGAEILAGWRADVSILGGMFPGEVVDDVSSRALEPELHEFENAGFRAWPGRERPHRRADPGAAQTAAWRVTALEQA